MYTWGIGLANGQIRFIHQKRLYMTSLLPKMRHPRVSQPSLHSWIILTFLSMAFLAVLFCSVLQPSSIWGLTYFLHLSLTSVMLIDSSMESPVHVLMLSIQAVSLIFCSSDSSRPVVVCVGGRNAADAGTARLRDRSTEGEAGHIRSTSRGWYSTCHGSATTNCGQGGTGSHAADRRMNLFLFQPRQTKAALSGDIPVLLV